MSKRGEKMGSGREWSESRWERVEIETRRRALEAGTELARWRIIIRQARAVLRTYSTSFFIVTRFLPSGKRERVEAIYSAVRYPDEIVDTFRISPEEQTRALRSWVASYEAALAARSIAEALDAGAPCFLAAFAKVVRESGIAPEHYRAFISAMELDANPRAFDTLDDLIDSYIYGSAIVVGYFLTHVYGASTAGSFNRALRSARDLAIALQLTNFLRDVAEDHRRNRLYLPLDMLAEAGIGELDPGDAGQLYALAGVLKKLSRIAEDYYESARGNIDAFAPDSRIAIRACIDVYAQLNNRMGRSPAGILHRESVPMIEKFRVLPSSKYWRLPLAYLFEGR
ncbi:MAG TPA: phytoene/squalene synthase family protein [Blastocatellia bacterium]|jgi:phytoene synthase